MITYRSFLNTDIPLITEIWRTHQPLRGLVHALSASSLEQHILSKPYFERNGLILAIDNGHPLGFVHVGFGASESLDDINQEIAVISMLMVSKSHVTHPGARDNVAYELLVRAEEFAASRSARRILGGGSFPNNPFYLGLYGGSRLPGILYSDKFTRSVFETHGYQSCNRVGIWQLELGSFRPIVNREQMQIRRKYNVHAELDPPPRSWWEACTLGHAERTKFELIERATERKVGEVNFWDMQPLAKDWGVKAAGMFDLKIKHDNRRGGLATFLIGEGLRQLRDLGATIAEVQTCLDDDAAIGLFEKTGFQQIDQGVLFEKLL